jgi:hypothetical protein
MDDLMLKEEEIIINGCILGYRAWQIYRGIIPSENLTIEQLFDKYNWETSLIERRKIIIKANEIFEMGLSISGACI